MNRITLSPVKKALTIVAVGVILFAVIPAAFSEQPYVFHIFIATMFNIILALALNLIMRTGQVPLCMAAFMGIGAYSSTLLVMRLHVPFWVSLPTAGVIGALSGILVGLPTLRIKGIHFAMATFGFGEIMRLIFIGWVSLFGGANGISGIPAPDPIQIPYLFTIEFESKISYYYLVLIFLLLSVVFFYRLTYSRIGRACMAIEESELLSECTGINSMNYKIFAFSVASTFSGMVGALYVHYIHFIGPQQFGFWSSVEYIVFVIIGGVGTFAGPIIGATFLTFLPEFARVAELWEVVIYGMALILTILFMPKGIKGFVDDFRSSFAKYVRET
jgi:branched-chain amino acid transport system permease protein